MPDTFARMRQLVGTTTEWAANDLIIGLGEIAIEKAGGASKIKIGDGSSRFSALPYASGETAAIAWANITGKPTTFPPSAHVHALADVTGLIDGAGNIQYELIPDTLKERLDWKGEHTPTLGAEYPPGAVTAGDTWGILGPSFTFSTGTLSGKTVSEGAALVYDAARWHIIGGGAGGASGEFVEVADLTTTSTGPTMAGLVPQLNTSGRLDPSLLNVPGALNFRGTVDITLPVPSAVNQGDYYLVGIGGVAHGSWTGIAGLTMQVNDQVIWTGVAWTYIRPPGAASGFVPLDGSTPMTGALSLAAYTVGQPVAANAIRKDYLDTRIADVPTAEESLGFLPLDPANNLSELTDDPAARSNLGLTATATMAPTAFIQTSLFTAAKQIPIALAVNSAGVIAAPGGPNLLLSTTTSSEVAWQTDWFLDTALNLSDVPDKAAARANLGVPDLTDIILKSTVDAAGDLIVGTGPDTVARLPRGADGDVLKATAAGIAWTAGGGLSLVGEAVSSGSVSFLQVAVPAAARILELYWYCNLASNQQIWLRGMNGVTINSSAKYHKMPTYFSQAGTMSGSISYNQTGWVLYDNCSICWGKATLNMPQKGIGIADYMFRQTDATHFHVTAGWETDQTMPDFDGFYLASNVSNFLAGSYFRVFAI